MVVGYDVSYDRLFVRMVDEYVLGIEELGQTELVLGYVEGVVQIVDGIALAELVVLYQLGFVLVDYGVEGQTVSPAGGEVPNVHIVITSGLHLTPEQQSVLGALGFLVVGLLDRDILDLESQNDGPYETEG